jgi:hypothetical protein
MGVATVMMTAATAATDANIVKTVERDPDISTIDAGRPRGGAHVNVSCNAAKMKR